MGYDMYWRRPGDADASYFRLNVWGMSLYAASMAQLGMAFHDDPHPPWPEVDDYGLTNEQVWAVEFPEEYPDEYASITPAVMEKAHALLAENERVRAWHGRADMPGIPLHKFGSNDGWIVLPDECQAAVRAWRAHVSANGEHVPALRAEGLGHWRQWIAFLEGAATHEGFEVF